MTRNHWFDLGPSLVLGAGILVSTLVAVLTAESSGLTLAGPLLLALAVVSADVLDARLNGAPRDPSSTALLLGGAFLLAGTIVTLRDPALVKTFMPILGGATWVILLLRPEGRRKACRGI